MTCMEKCKWRKCKKVETSLVVVQWLRIHLAKKKKRIHLTMQGVQVRSIPGLGTKIPHAVEQIRPCTMTREPRCH